MVVNYVGGVDASSPMIDRGKRASQKLSSSSCNQDKKHPSHGPDAYLLNFKLNQQSNAYPYYLRS